MLFKKEKRIMLIYSQFSDYQISLTKSIEIFVVETATDYRFNEIEHLYYRSKQYSEVLKGRDNSNIYRNVSSKELF